MADDVKQQLKLSQSLVMTPQLQMAIKMLATPSTELMTMVAATRGIEPAESGDPDPLQAPDEEERELQEETGVTPWSFLLEPPAELAPADHVDVWIFGNPPVARANRAALPRLRPAAAADREAVREAAWLFRSLRQRAKIFERVVEVVLELRPQLAIATPDSIKPVPIRDVADKLAMHESTITRVATACRVQNLHGVWSLAAGKRGIGLAAV